MAEFASLQQLQEIPSHSPILQREVRTGDLLFGSGEYVISNMIKKVTHSMWSHLCIFIRFEELDSIYLLESIADVGVRLIPLSKYTEDYDEGKPYKGTLVATRVEGVGPTESKKIIQFGLELLGLPYDTDEIVKSLFRIIRKKGTLERDREFTCSELVYECFLHAGIELNYDPRGFVSPESLWEDIRLSPLWKINTNNTTI